MPEFSFVDGNVPSGANWNTNVRDQLCIICTSGTRPASPATGRHIWETDTLKGFFYNGSAWVQIEDGGEYAVWTTYTPTWTGSTTNPSLGNGSLSGYYKLWKNTLFVGIVFAAGTTTTFGTGYWGWSLPLSVVGTGSIVGMGGGQLVDISTGYAWPVFYLYSGSPIIAYSAVGSGDTRTTELASTYPFTWATSDTYILHGEFEVV